MTQKQERALTEREREESEVGKHDHDLRQREEDKKRDDEKRGGREVETQEEHNRKAAQAQSQYEQGTQFTKEQRELVQERRDKAKEVFEEQEKSNEQSGEYAEMRRWQPEQPPGMHPANQPADPDGLINKGTRLDLEDLTGNPGHRGINPHAPAVSVTTGESGAPVPKVPERQTGATGAHGEQQSSPAPELHSINEPPGSVIIPPGTGGPDEHYPPLEGEDEELVITSLDPDEVELGGEDVTLHVHGSGFTEASVVVFNGGDEQTTFVSESELTTLVRPSTASGVATVPVMVRDGDDESEPHDFDFIADSTPEARDERKAKRATAKKPEPKKKKKAAAKRKR